MSNGHSWEDRVIERRKIRIGDIRANKWNPRSHPHVQRERLEATLNKFGIIGDLIAFKDDDGEWTLFDGHARQELDPDQEWTVAFTSLTRQEVNELVLLYDPLAALARQEADKTMALMADLEVQEAALHEMLEEQAQGLGFAFGENDSGYEHEITKRGRGYSGHDIEPFKLAYRIEAAWRAKGGLALDLFSGDGQLAMWYRRRFERVVTNDVDIEKESSYHLHADEFIKSHLDEFMGFDFVDFDDEGTPALEIQELFSHVSGRKENAFILALTDGNGMNLKFRGRLDFGKTYLVGGDSGLRQATRRDYDEFEQTVSSFVARCARGAGFKPGMLSSYRGRGGNVVYQTWLIEPIPIA
jgi:hypothetical protein